MVAWEDTGVAELVGGKEDELRGVSVLRGVVVKPVDGDPCEDEGGGGGVLVDGEGEGLSQLFLPTPVTAMMSGTVLQCCRAMPQPRWKMA